ncbi:MAG: HAMP domain-containing sensor histidine kinase, partial [Pseudomonadota bacterium]
KQHEYLDHINSSAQVLRALVDDILDLASIDAGTMHLTYETINFTTAVEKVVNSLEGAIDQKGIVTDIVVGDKRSDFTADQERLHQILFNLVSNAVNFSPDGGSVVIAGKSFDEVYEIRVSDEGPGIGKDERDKVFDRFEARAATGSRHGIGLGLSLARGFVEMHGGTITIEDSASGGACFVCKFPHTPLPQGERDDSVQSGLTVAA